MARGIIVRNLDVTLMSELATRAFGNTSICETTDGDVTRLTIDLEMSPRRVSILLPDAHRCCKPLFYPVTTKVTTFWSLREFVRSLSISRNRVGMKIYPPSFSLLVADINHWLLSEIILFFFSFLCKKINFHWNISHNPTIVILSVWRATIEHLAEKEERKLLSKFIASKRYIFFFFHIAIDGYFNFSTNLDSNLEI